MKVRAYSFVTGIETSSQPDSGTPAAANDIVTKSYADSLVAGAVGTDIQEAVSGTVNGSNVNFTVSQTPIAGSFRLYRNGSLLRTPTHYSRTGVNITMVVAPVVGQDLDATYRY